MKAAREEMDKMQKSADKTKDFIKGAFGELAGPAVSIGAGAALGIFLKSSIDAAAGLEEMHNRAQVVFGNDFPAAERQSQILAASLNRSESDMLGFATNFALVAEGLGIGSKQADEMSTSLTRLAVDFSKAMGGSQEQAAQAITLALEGNGRALRQYGIVLNDNTLQEFASTQGIKDKVSAMSQAQKAYLTEQFLLSNTGKIQEAAARNTGSLRDETEQFKSAWHDMLEETGKPLLPGVTAIMRGL